MSTAGEVCAENATERKNSLAKRKTDQLHNSTPRNYLANVRKTLDTTWEQPQFWLHTQNSIHFTQSIQVFAKQMKCEAIGKHDSRLAQFCEQQRQLR